ncbi:hypothetical protein GCM10011348_15600 [Marinobacterium nitratireducens]|uniref:Uncharacterized protein n=1 Tax=Marinobacterium nitratireducens TaxID=518897 RepID=A0A917ZDK0_9GAMM|nr:hypothetical protein [Marinobacterium nitratireducens]GGO79969.1 hypothetical protein GCM10011348_15600 [Marinobacterium nitratireducens]
MSPTETGLLILAGVLALAVAAYVAQQIENQRQARRLQLMALRENIRRASYLLESLPPQFQTSEIRQVIGATINSFWDRLLKLENKAENRAQQEAFKQQLAQPLPATPFPAGSLTLMPDRDSARRARAQLRELGQFIKQQHDRGELSAQAASLTIRQVKSGYHRVTVDLSILDAIEIETGRGPQVAVHQYRNCLGKLRSIKGGHTEQQIANLQARLATVEAQIERAERDDPAAGDQDDSPAP